MNLGPEMTKAIADLDAAAKRMELAVGNLKEASEKAVEIMRRGSAFDLIYKERAQ